MIKKRKTIIISISLLSIFFILTGCNSKATVKAETKSTIQVVSKDIDFQNKLIEIKRQITSIVSSTSDTDNINNFIDENKERDEVKNDLCNFIIEKWNAYLTSGKENANDNLSTALLRVKLDYPNNIEVQKLYSQYSQHKYNSGLKEVVPPVVSKNLTSSDGNLELLDYKSEDGYIVGTIKNNSNNNYSYVEVDINLLDKDGNQVGNTISNVENLSALNNWKFRAVVVEKNVSKFTVVSIKANK